MDVPQCADLDVIGSDDQKIVEEEGFAGRSVGMSRVDSMTTVAFGRHYGQNSFTTEDVVGPCQQNLMQPHLSAVRKCVQRNT
ncbi:hypothetical protein HN51_058268 [Arachis hypogaea]